MFRSEEDLSRGLSRADNHTDSNEHTGRPPIYTAYTQPADTSYNTVSAEEYPSAVPPPKAEAEKTETRKKRHFRKTAAILVVIALLFCCAGVFALLFRVDIDSSGSGISVSISRRSQTGTGAQTVELPAGPENAQNAEAALHSEAAAGSGVRLAIARSPQRTGGVLSYREIYEKCSPSVVTVGVDTYSGSYIGTGIIMQADGYIITNANLIEGAYSVTVTTGSGAYPASLVGSDAMSDLAVLKIDVSGLVPAEFGDSELMRVGDEVAAIGNPLGLGLTMTNGIISGINLSVPTGGGSVEMLQTNTVINEGSYGGPLINVYGQVIGITNITPVNSRLYTDGMTYAIPSSYAKTIVDELIEHGHVSGRPGIGLTLEEIPETARIYYGLPRGLYVRSVYANSDAYAQGIRPGDVIIAVNGTAVSTNTVLNEVKSGFSVGESVVISVYRSGVTTDVAVTLMDMSEFND